MNLEKKALRKQIIEQTDALPADYLAESDKGIFDIITSMPEFISARTIFSYYSLGWEPDTVKLLEYALRLGKTVTLPVCFKGGVMEARAIGSLSELSESWYHLLEPLSSTRVMLPEELDFIVVPALAFDLEGYRLGRGGGYYDRFLVKTQAFTVGITRERLLYERLPREAHDVPVRCVVTEKRAGL
ncbi:MAG: 5-formyltetrahydrofolate cyclo-ligase [Clostridiales bacterium]|nr:5-formyltetrahydrofolate cyclo-ligase [Clostridiales bacterium]